MSWHYLQGQEEVSSEGISWDGDAFAPSKSKTTLGEYSLPDNETECCPASPSGATCVPSTGTHGEGESMSSAAGSPARTSAPPARGQASQASGLGFGGRWHELSVKFDLATSSWKTHLCLWAEDLPWSSVTLPRWGMMLDGVCWELTTQGPPTAAREFGYWPTPRTTDPDRGGRGDLIQAVSGNPNSHYKMLATPTATANQLCPSMQKHPGCRAMWPTPAATDHKGSSRPGQRRGQLTDPNMGAIKDGGQLNPTWVEWLMGFPLGWTDLKPLAMDKFHNAPPWHGKF